MVYDNTVGPELREQTRLIRQQITLARLQILVSIQTSNVSDEEKARLISKLDEIGT